MIYHRVSSRSLTYQPVAGTGRGQPLPRGV